MHIILIISFLLVGLLLYFISNKVKVNKRISIWGCFILFFYGALRSTSVGTDVQSYTDTYLTLPYMSFKEIFSSITIVSRDPFFYTFLKMLTYINDDPQFMLMVISAIVAICVSIFIYKNSVNPILSFTMFITLRYYSFTLTGLRQAIAWAVVILSYEFIKEKKPLKFILTVCLAALFHKSALVFLLAYPLANVKRIDIMTLIASLILGINFITNGLIIKLIVQIPLLDQYQSYVFGGETTSSGSTLLLIYISIILFAFVVRNKIISKGDDIYLMYNLTIVGIAITTLSFEYANVFRIGYYFIFPIIILFPIVINRTLDKKFQQLLIYTVILVLTAQFIFLGPGAGTVNYNFFWQ